jgi:hypothetical protein
LKLALLSTCWEPGYNLSNSPSKIVYSRRVIDRYCCKGRKLAYFCLYLIGICLVKTDLITLALGIAAPSKLGARYDMHMEEPSPESLYKEGMVFRKTKPVNDNQGPVSYASENLLT